MVEKFSIIMGNEKENEVLREKNQKKLLSIKITM